MLEWQKKEESELESGSAIAKNKCVARSMHAAQRSEVFAATASVQAPNKERRCNGCVPPTTAHRRPGVASQPQYVSPFTFNQ